MRKELIFALQLLAAVWVFTSAAPICRADPAQPPSTDPSSGADASVVGPAAIYLPHNAPEAVPTLDDAQTKQVLDLIRDNIHQLNDARHLHLKEIETAHFLIFTDWDPREYGFLKDNTEAAYATITRAFGGNPRDNVFMGKLEILMFADSVEFRNFAGGVDKFSKSETAWLLGYYLWREQSLPHIAMVKPTAQTAGGIDAQKEWGYVLADQLTYAYLARYRTTRDAPNWLNEGIAQTLAASLFPRDVKALAAREVNADLTSMFNDEPQPDAMSPVMRTMTEVLILRDRAGFLKFYNEIKDGEAPADALKKVYGWTYDDLGGYWKKYVKSR